MNECENNRIISYDTNEELTLVNRQTGKSCTFKELNDSYVIMDEKTFERAIIKRCSEDELKCYFYMQNVINNSSDIRQDKKIDAKFNYLSCLISDLVMPNEEIPIYVDNEDIKEYYLHIISYKK